METKSDTNTTLLKVFTGIKININLQSPELNMIASRKLKEHKQKYLRIGSSSSHGIVK